MNKIAKWVYTISKNGRHQISEIGGCQVALMWNCRKRNANAHLIAAAPEMYAMLERLYTESALVYGDDYDEVEKLLTKARGEL